MEPPRIFYAPFAISRDKDNSLLELTLQLPNASVDSGTETLQVETEMDA
jgi:hypothetical protein